jgi:hypothetical protein
MAPPIQLISTDFDGTVFSEFEQPPVPLELQALLGRLQAAGVTWVINTGRDMSSLMECLGRAHLTVKPDFLVLVEREIYRHAGTRYVPIEPWNENCRRDHEVLFARVRQDLPALLSWINERFDATLYEDSFSPLCLIAGSNEDADVIVDYLERYCETVPELSVMRNDVYARFSHSAYNKGTALAHIGSLVGRGADVSVAAGDHFNDMPMLSRAYAERLIAPANAIEMVKRAVLEQGGYVARLPRGEGVLEGLKALLGTQSGL